MAATAAIVERGLSFGKWKATFCTVTMDSSMAAGGEAITGFPNSVGLGKVIGAVVCGAEDGYPAVWDLANSKLIAWYADYDAGADGALVSATGVDLSSAVYHMIFFGV
jgi:hypothetical protein